MKYRKKIVDGHEVVYSPDWINDLESEIHFNWYYHQAELVYSNCTRDQKILEIGIGTGLLSDLLKKRGWDLITLDIDEEKRPDIVGNAVDFDYLANSIDVVLAFEIFEHIPYSTFEKVVQKLAEAKVQAVYFSLPWNERELLDFSFKMPKLNRKNWRLSLGRGEIATTAHFWELSKRGKNISRKKLVSLPTIMDLFERHGFVLTEKKKVGLIQYFSADK